MPAEATYETLRAKLGHVLPDPVLRYAAPLVDEVQRLKREKHAAIPAHNYIDPLVYNSVADFCGDSLDLSRWVAQIPQPLIVFCGVRFMAETAKILSPQKTVFLPSPRGGCSLAESVTAHDVRLLRRMFPGLPVVSYVNTTAEVKAESDICCTSSNAVTVIRSLGTNAVIFLPDEYLARNVARELGWNFVAPDAKGWLPKPTGQRVHACVIGWRGRCEVHERFTVADIENARRQFPDVVVLAHPECRPAVVAAADFTGSTNAMMRFVRHSPAKRFFLLTECAMADNLAAAHPDKEMIRLCSLRCPHMNEIGLEDVRLALEQGQYLIEVPDAVATKARQALDRMLKIH